MKTGHGSEGFGLEVPRWLAFRNVSDTPFNIGDRVQIAGFEYTWATVYNVTDIGAGFPNEHRSIFCFRPNDSSWDSLLGFYIAAANSAVVPPEDAEMLEETPPVDFWQDPEWYVPPAP